MSKVAWLSIALFIIPGLPAFAAKEVHQFEVSLYVPKPVFYVLPSESDWIHRNQYLEWDVVNSRLGSLRKQFDVRNDSGAIAATITSKAVLSNGIEGQDIALVVSFNDVVVSEFLPVEVVTAADARMGSRVLLEITPIKPVSGYLPGSYYGSVNVLFNAVAPQ